MTSKEKSVKVSTILQIISKIDKNFKIYNDYRKEFLKTKVEEL